jgi:hypothetical protein
MPKPSDKRKICWPVFDRTCLEGGCLWCSEGRLVQLDTIRRKVSASEDVLMERAYRAGLYSSKVEWQ